MMLNPLKTICFLYFIVSSFAVWSVNPISIKKETPVYILDIKYPQEFKDPRINAAIQDFIEKTKKLF